jgi:1-acyl-sn-glycerol-3-phosphate acyltransferase
MEPGSQFRLLLERRFGPFFACQLAGAFNDNVFKNALVLLVTYHAAAYSSLDPGLLTNLAAGIFILPFVLFSASAGQIADKYDKRIVIRVIKAVEIAIMAIAGIGLYLHSLPILLGALFLLGVHSTFFGPVKYAILPQVLDPRELMGGNGLVETGTFLAILGGTLVAGLLVMLEDGTRWVTLLILLISVLGFLASLAIPSAPPAAAGLRMNWNPVTQTLATLKFARGNRTVFLSLLGISWFWFYGALFLSQFPNYSRGVLGGSEQVATLLLALFSIGVAIGSLLCERLSGHKVEIGLVPFGSIGMSVFAVDLFFATPAAASTVAIGAWQFLAQPGSWRIAADLLLIGMFGGFYIVPLYALVQSRCEPSHRSRVIAANNILNALFMVAAAAIAVLALGLGATVPQLMLLTGIFNLVVAVYIYALVPEFLLRFIDWMLIHSIFRLKTRGTGNFPEQDAALLVCNHQSLADAMVIAAACRRPIRFVMYHAIYDIPVLNFVFRSMKAIPIAGAKEAPEVLEKAYDEIAKALEDGQLVCIFPEGQLTPDGKTGPFRPGMMRILDRTPVPVIPMALSGLWKSIFARNREVSIPFAKLFPTVRLNIGEPLAQTGVTLEGVRERVIELEAFHGKTSGRLAPQPGTAS